jgi:hypothetical protein
VPFHFGLLHPPPFCKVYRVSYNTLVFILFCMYLFSPLINLSISALKELGEKLLVIKRHSSCTDEKMSCSRLITLSLWQKKIQYKKKREYVLCVNILWHCKRKVILGRVHGHYEGLFSSRWEGSEFAERKRIKINKHLPNHTLEIKPS